MEEASRLVLPDVGKGTTGFSQIVALIKRSDSIPIKSEGTRVVVNVVKSLWLLERDKEPSVDTQKKRDKAITYLLTPECAGILAALIARSNRYPILVNEGLVAMTLLSTDKRGGEFNLLQTVGIASSCLRSTGFGGTFHTNQSRCFVSCDASQYQRFFFLSPNAILSQRWPTGSAKRP